MAPRWRLGWRGRSAPALMNLPPGARLAQPARSAARAAPKLPRDCGGGADVARAHSAQGAHGAWAQRRSAASREPPPVRLRVSRRIPTRMRAHRDHARARGSAGRQDASRGHARDARAYVAAVSTARRRWLRTRRFLRECGIADLARRAHPASRIRQELRALLRHRRCRHHQRRLRAGGYRHAGDAFQPAGSAPDFAAAAGAYRGGAARAHADGPR